MPEVTIPAAHVAVFAVAAVTLGMVLIAIQWAVANAELLGYAAVLLVVALAAIQASR